MVRNTASGVPELQADLAKGVRRSTDYGRYWSHELSENLQIYKRNFLSE